MASSLDVQQIEDQRFRAPSGTESIAEFVQYELDVSLGIAVAQWMGYA